VYSQVAGPGLSMTVKDVRLAGCSYAIKKMARRIA
jgi:hypothetical protein